MSPVGSCGTTVRSHSAWVERGTSRSLHLPRGESRCLSHVFRRLWLPLALLCLLVWPSPRPPRSMLELPGLGGPWVRTADLPQFTHGNCFVFPYLLLRRPLGEQRVSKAELNSRFDDCAEGRLDALLRLMTTNVQESFGRSTVMNPETRAKTACQRVRMSTTVFDRSHIGTRHHGDSCRVAEQAPPGPPPSARGGLELHPRAT